jgi:hypothetical protein
MGQAALAVDGGGRPYLVQLAGFAGSQQGDEGASPAIQVWSWADSFWQVEEGFVTQPGSLTGVDGVAAVISANGNLSVLYSGLSLNVETGRLEAGYLASGRSLTVDPAAPIPTPTIATTTTITTNEVLTGTATPTPVPTIEPTPTVFFPADPDSGGGFNIPFLGSLGFIGAIVPIGLGILMIVLVSIRLVRRSQN